MSDAFAAVFRETLSAAAQAVGVPLDDAALALCTRFADAVRAGNERLNLTRIVAADAMAVKHFADSLTVLAAAPELPEGATVIDVGTGAGFPGVPLQIARPDLNLILVDSLAKRLAFLDETLKALGIDGVSLVHARAEDAGRDAALRDRGDLVTARALAALPTLIEWCAPLVRPGGKLIAMKGSEVESALDAPRLLGLRHRETRTLTLPDDEAAGRTLIVYDKIRETPVRFPRRAAEIKARPLL